MSSVAKPPIFSTAFRSWKDAFDAIRRNPLLFIIGIALYAVLESFMEVFFPSRDGDATLTRESADFLRIAIESFVLAPLAIVMHRYVLLNDAGGRYSLNPFERRFAYFFLFSLVFVALVWLPCSALILFTQLGSDGAMSAPIVAAAVIAAILLVVTGLYFSIRLLLVFPAIAIDSQTASWSSALADTKGHVWRLILIMIVTTFPTIVGAFVHVVVSADAGLTIKIASTAIFAIVQGITLCATAAAASHLYSSLARRLTGEQSAFA